MDILVVYVMFLLFLWDWKWPNWTYFYERKTEWIEKNYEN